MITGLVALTSAAPALAQGKAKPAAPAGKAPAKPAAPPAGKPAAKPAAPAKPAEKKPMTEKQKKEAARKAYKDAEAKFKAAEYKAALELYKQADEYLPIPATKYKIAVCEDKLNQIHHAAAAYQVFLDSSPGDKMADAMADAKTRLEALKKTPGKIRIAFEPANLPKLAVSIDGAAPQAASAMTQETVTPQPAPVEAADPKAPPPPPPPSYQASTASVAPGKHKVTATAEGYDPATAEVDVKFASHTDVKLALQKTPPPPPPPEPVAQAPAAPPPPPPPPPAPRSNVPAYVTLGLAGAGLVVGGVFGGLALKAKGDFNSAKPPTTDLADKVDRNALIADMSFAVALTFGVTGAVLLLSHDTPAAQPAQENKAALYPAPKKTAVRGFVTPYFSPQGGGAAAFLQF